MCTFYHLIQLAISAIIFVSVIVNGVAYVIGDNLSCLGLFAVIIFAGLTFTLMRISFIEYKSKK